MYKQLSGSVLFNLYAVKQQVKEEKLTFKITREQL